MNSEKACRVCLIECEDLTPLYRNMPGENKTLEDALNFVANINIRLGDGLPDKICTICETVLDLADTFKQRCLESESILGQQAQEEQNLITLPRCDKTDQGSIEINPEDTSCLPSSISQTSLTDALSEITESAVNIYDLPEHKIKIEIEEYHVDTGITLSEQGNFVRADERLKEQCLIKKEFSLETTKHSDDKDIFLCLHCNLTLKTKIAYKVHILFNHSKFCHRKDAPILKKAKLEAMHPTTAEVRSATEDPAAADTSTAAVIGTESDFKIAKKYHIIKKIRHGENSKQKEVSKHIMKKEITKHTATLLKLSGTRTDDKISCATEKQSECSNNTVIGTPGDIPTCGLYGYTTATEKNLNLHTGEKPYPCDVCEKRFSRKSTLVEHVRIHTGDKPYSCKVCGIKFRHHYSLVTHILRTHTGVMPYDCDVCQKQFTKKCDLDKHIRTHAGEKPYSCDVCGRQFRLRTSLVVHARIHTGYKPYSCEVCEKRFTEKHNLVVHLRTHAGVRPYSCDVCQKQFSHKHSLNAHMGIHTGAKPYSCDVCQKQFRIKPHLNNHMRTHTGERPYSCDVCGRKFSLKHSLVEHARIHTGDKPYSCDVCEKRFTQKQHLDRHLRTHTGEKPYSCNMCQKQFSRKHHLNKHMKTHIRDKTLFL